MHEQVINAPSSSFSRPPRHDRDRSGSRPHDVSSSSSCSSSRPHHKRKQLAGAENVPPAAEDTTSAASSTSPSPSRSPSRKRRLSGSAHKQSHSSTYHNRSASPSPAREMDQEKQAEEEGAQAAVLSEQPVAKEEEEEGGNGALAEAHADDSFRDEENWEHPNSFNPDCRRTLRIEYWDRLRSVKERKWDHMDYIDATYPSREQWILQSVLHKDETVIEENMFPYNTPKGIVHLTLWSRHELTLEEVEAFVWKWIETERPEVVRWNLDENASRSINVYHSHVYAQLVPDEEVGPPAEDDQMDEVEEKRETPHATGQGEVDQQQQQQHQQHQQQQDDNDKVPPEDEEEQPQPLKKPRICQPPSSHPPSDDRAHDLEAQKTPPPAPQQPQEE